MKKRNKTQVAANGRATGNKNSNSSNSSDSIRSPPPPPQEKRICPASIKGIDDAGTFYNSHQELLTAQTNRKTEFYHANASYWGTGGYGGTTDDEAMIGDGGGVQDGQEGLAFLDRLASLNQTPHHNSHAALDEAAGRFQFEQAVDLGAGVGRVSKLVLLKRYSEVRLVEADEGWSKRSKTYLGRKRASRCSFVNQRLDELRDEDVRNWGPPADLMWVQWTLQYLIDQDVVDCLRVLASGLRPETGVLVVKENRPYGTAREDRFQMDLPGGVNERYDITRSDTHHRLLFQNAGLRVAFVERGVETNTYALMR